MSKLQKQQYKPSLIVENLFQSQEFQTKLSRVDSKEDFGDLSQQDQESKVQNTFDKKFAKGDLDSMEVEIDSDDQTPTLNLDNQLIKRMATTITIDQLSEVKKDQGMVKPRGINTVDIYSEQGQNSTNFYLSNTNNVRIQTDLVGDREEYCCCIIF